MVILARRLLIFLICVALRVWLAGLYPAEETPIWMAIILHVLTALAALGFALVLDGALRHFFWNGYLAQLVPGRIPRLLPLTISAIIYASTLLNLLKYDHGLSLGGALAASGAIALILGFALRSVILDLFTGLAVSIDRSYVVGDWITVTSRDLPAPVYGRVEDIDWRTTRLRLENGTKFVMPNSLGGSYALTNHSQPPGPKRLAFTLLLPHETPSDRALMVLEGACRKAMEAEGLYLTPAPSVVLEAIENHGVRYQVRIYVNVDKLSPFNARSLVQRAVHAAVLQNGLSFPGDKVELRNRERAHGAARKASADVIAALKRAPLFSGSLTTEELTQLAQAAHRRTLSAGTSLIREGDAGQSLFILLAGAARVERRGEQEAIQRLTTLSAGDFVGEMSLLTGDARSASVVAETSVDAIEIDKDHLAPILRARPVVAEALSSVMAKRIAARDAMKDGSGVAAMPDHLPIAHRLLGSMQAFFGLNGLPKTS